MEQKVQAKATNTINSYQRMILALLKENSRPDQYCVKEFLSQKQDAGASSGTIANYVKAYRSFFKYLFENGMYDINPGYFKIPKIQYKERHLSSDEDVAKLLQVADTEEDKLALTLLIDTGLRRHEMATIKKKNVDCNDGSIRVRGKGGKDRTVYISQITADSTRVRANAHSRHFFPVFGSCHMPR